MPSIVLAFYFGDIVSRFEASSLPYEDEHEEWARRKLTTVVAFCLRAYGETDGFGHIKSHLLSVTDPLEALITGDVGISDMCNIWLNFDDLSNTFDFPSSPIDTKLRVANSQNPIRIDGWPLQEEYGKNPAIDSAPDWRVEIIRSHTEYGLGHGVWARDYTHQDTGIMRLGMVSIIELRNDLVARSGEVLPANSLQTTIHQLK